MGFQNGLWPLIIFLSIFSLIGSCHNSKITFPTEGNMDHNELNISPTNSSIVSVEATTPTLSSSSQESQTERSSMVSNSTSLFSLFFGDGDNNEIVEDRSQLSLRDNENEMPEVKGFVRSLEITDSREVYNPDRKLRDSMEDRWNGWNFEEKNNNKRWRYPPDEKTIQLQVLDEDPYHHGRPAWPHDEYLVGYFDMKGGTPERSNGSSASGSENYVDSTLSPDEVSKYYEWKRLQPRPSPSAFIGPGFYDVSSLNPEPSGDYYRYHQPSFQAITTDGTGKVQTTGSSSSSGGGSSQEQGSGVPGTPSESNTNTRHFPAYAAYDYYKRKRLRLQIHPGLIAAPLAGLAAFGAASALTSKPLLVELGYVRNKPDAIGGGYPGGWGWAGNQGTGYRPYPHFYPPPNPPPLYPPIGVGTGSVGPHYPGGGGLGGFGGGLAHGGASHSAGGGGGPLYPILKPHRHRPESERSSWWNPFSALTPRLHLKKKRWMGGAN